MNNTGDTTNAMDSEVCPQTCLVVDAIGVVQELKAVRNFKNCKEFGATYMKLIDSKTQGYDQVRVIFGNYTVLASTKEGTRQGRRGKSMGIRSKKVEHSTRIRDKKMFIASNETKDSLTLYLTQWIQLLS